MEPLDDDTARWLEAVVPILRAVRQRSISSTSGLEMIAENFRVQGDADTYMDVLTVFYDELGAPNEDEYILRPANVTPASVRSELRVRTCEGNLRDGTTKAVYMMLFANEEWPWNTFVDNIEARLGELYHENKEISEIGQGEYAGLIGSLVVLAERGRISKAKKLLHKKRKDKTLLLALHLSRKHEKSAAACALALLLVGDHSQRDKSESNKEPFKPIKKPNMAEMPQWRLPKRSNATEKAIQQAKKMLNKIVSQPEDFSHIVGHMHDLARRANLNFSKSDLETDKDLSSLHAWESK